MSKSGDPNKSSVYKPDETVSCDDCSAFITRKQVTTGSVVMVLGRLYHLEHLKCVFCKIPLRGNLCFPSLADATKPACYDCNMNTRHAPCHECNEPLKEFGLSALGRLWHRKCFRCASCHKIIPNGDYFAHDGHPFDEDCYGEAVIVGNARKPSVYYFHQKSEMLYAPSTLDQRQFRKPTNNSSIIP
ncbi:unnamed protein product [Caenorhabditis auriculariae]|uniref:LIM zinc-binding domain-containing protein n=1 Tax=Caenorhabditis auriculariae TaxID=2777116 RepID=A0A8S1H8T2_9PELO|nr:unnamed protein product [Caenorhabditis auriculariae]